MIVTLEPLDGRLWLVTWLKVINYIGNTFDTPTPQVFLMMDQLELVT
jgi:hypothetical protein